MSYNAYRIIQIFEQEVAKYTGFDSSVATNSCTKAIWLALKYKLYQGELELGDTISIPKHTYVGVAQQIKLLGFELKFHDDDWEGYYQIGETGVYDSAKYFSKFMDQSFKETDIVCLSHHYTKPLSCMRGGSILINNATSYKKDWFDSMKFDGRTPLVGVKDDKIVYNGDHINMQVENAAHGLVNLMGHIEGYKPFVPSQHYPDLSKMEVFK
jgi:dTDP-4-amino-4,6-dideoxygalactose transaminase